MPSEVMERLCVHLVDDWQRLIGALPESEAFSESEISTMSLSSNPPLSALIQLGNRGVNALQFMQLADKCGLARPQLVLRRKLAAVRLKTPTPMLSTTENTISLTCDARGFPYPTYEWLYCNEPIASTSTAVLRLPRCHQCTRSGLYSCRVSNRIEPHAHWSHYVERGYQTESTVVTQPINVELTTADLCPTCRSCKIMQRVSVLSLDPGSTWNDTLPSPTAHDVSATSYVAVDKIALIIANSEYEHLSSLRTPPCDAQTIADGLLGVGFKTVTLADLTKTEMLRLIGEYDRMLGTAGVYAVFYFVGHGFETSGQCFLVPVDAPVDYTLDDCIAVDSVLAVMQPHNPALNLILLDMCRRDSPTDMSTFTSKQPYNVAVNRNTVFGYATSMGVGAYEVVGEANGVFVKYAKNHLFSGKSIVAALGAVLRDLERDPKASPVQFPELRTNLSRPLSLSDAVVFTGHTCSFDVRTAHWQTIHELPNPSHVEVPAEGLRITIWFDYCGHYCNMAFVFANVDRIEDTPCPHDVSRLRAYLQFDAPVVTGDPTMCDEIDEGVSVRVLVKNLQKVTTSHLSCAIRVIDEQSGDLVCKTSTMIEQVLVMRL